MSGLFETLCPNGKYFSGKAKITVYHKIITTRKELHYFSTANLKGKKQRDEFSLLTHV
jgi:hypothetical protein